MIDRQGGKILVECDSCDNVIESEPGEQDFAAMWTAAKREGWKTRKIANEWLHSCPDCKAPT